METINTASNETKETVQTSAGLLSFPAFVGSSNAKVIAKAWEKDDKVRVYFSAFFGKGKVDCGYYDVKNRKSFLFSNPKNTARMIESEITIID